MCPSADQQPLLCTKARPMQNLRIASNQVSGRIQGTASKGRRSWAATEMTSTKGARALSTYRLGRHFRRFVARLFGALRLFRPALGFALLRLARVRAVFVFGSDDR